MRSEKYDDRIVLTNPGLLKLPIEQIYQGGESKARNQRMQNMFRMIGYEVKLTLYLENETNQDGIKDGVKDGVKQPSDIQRHLIYMMKLNPYITTKELAQKTNIKFRTLQRYISQLQSMGILVRKGSRKDGYWMINE